MRTLLPTVGDTSWGRAGRVAARSRRVTPTSILTLRAVRAAPRRRPGIFRHSCNYAHHHAHASNWVVVRTHGFEPCCHGNYELATPRAVDEGMHNLAPYASRRRNPRRRQSSPSFIAIASDRPPSPCEVSREVGPVAAIRLRRGWARVEVHDQDGASHNSPQCDEDEDAIPVLE